MFVVDMNAVYEGFDINIQIYKYILNFLISEE